MASKVTQVSAERSLKFLKELGAELYEGDSADELAVYWQRALDNANPLWHYAQRSGFSNGDAHVMALIDSRLPELGFLGFYEAREVSVGGLMNEAETWLGKRGCKQIVGPFDGSILQRFRLSQNNGQKFPGEPINPTYYLNQWKEAGFKPFNHYVSGIRKDFGTVLSRVEQKSQELPPGFRIRELDPENFESEMKLAHRLSLEIFRGTSQYFVEYSWEEFAHWYLPRRSHINPRYFEFLYYHDQPIGACHSFVHHNQLVIKTIGVLPEFQKHGAGGLLIYSQHIKAAEDNLDAAIYALVRVGNAVTKMTYPGVDIFRRYLTFEQT